MMTVKRDGLPYEEMGYCPPPNRKLPPVPGQHSNYNTIDRIKNGKTSLADNNTGIKSHFRKCSFAQPFIALVKNIEKQLKKFFGSIY